MSGQSASACILVVDPVTERHVVYRVLLEDLDRHIETVGSCDDAERVLGEGRVAVLLYHVNGAGTREAEAVAVQHLREAHPEMSTIIIAPSPQDVHLGGPASGEIDYVPSPIVPEILLSKVKAFVELHRLRAGRAQLAAFAGDLAHRGKNLLAILQSITVRTLLEGRSIADARRLLTGRLQALARAHDRLATSAWEGVPLADVVEGELEAYGGQVQMSGPPVRLRGSAVQTFTLAIHELAANAAAFGALSAPGGTVAVTWDLVSDGAGRHLEFSWTERGGPAPVKSPQPGFGLTLVSATVGSTARDRVFTFAPEGLTCRLRLPPHMIVSG